MKRAQIIEQSTKELDRLVREHGLPNTYTVQEVAAGRLFKFQVGRYGDEIAALYTQQYRHPTRYIRSTPEFVAAFSVEP